MIVDDGLYAFIERGPKRYDLRRDGRYALHCFPPENNEDAFYITGRTEHRDDASLLAAVHERFWSERPHVQNPPNDPDPLSLFEFSIATCLLTRTTGHGDFHPQHTIWKAADVVSS